MERGEEQPPVWPKEMIDLSEFAIEFQRETDRGAALVGAAAIDHHLADTLRAFMISRKAAEALIDGARAPLGTFSSRIDAVFALGLIDSIERADCHLIRKIRNEFAHQKHGLTFKNAKITDLVFSLKTKMRSDSERPESRIAFNEAVLRLTGELMSRSSDASRQKRVARARKEDL